MTEAAAAWPFSFSDKIRFSDLDTQGHLNNVAFLVFVESARIAYAVSVAEPDEAPFGTQTDYTFMVVEVKIAYRSPGQFGETIETRLRPSQVGRSSSRPTSRCESASGCWPTVLGARHLRPGGGTLDPGARPPARAAHRRRSHPALSASPRNSETLRATFSVA